MNIFLNHFIDKEIYIFSIFATFEFLTVLSSGLNNDIPAMADIDMASRQWLLS